MLLGPYIPASICQYGYLYQIFARNFQLGVYIVSEEGFVGIREKFGNTDLQVEYHYESGAPFGTALPYSKLERCPIHDLRTGFVWQKSFLVNTELQNYLLEVNKQYASQLAST